MAKYFEEATDAILVFQHDELLIANRLAQQFQAEFKIDASYLVSLAKTAIEERTSTIDDCYPCTARNSMTRIAIPFTVNAEGENPIVNFMVYTSLDEKNGVYSLTLKSRGMVQRMNQIAQQKRLVQYVNRAHEEERKRISQDLHDSIAQGVYSTIIGLHRLIDASSDERKRQIAVLDSELHSLLNEIKGIAVDIRPAVLDSFGLDAALRALAQRLEENTGLTIRLIIRTDTSQLSDDLATVLYRIAQESMTNVLKHTEADEVIVLLVGHDHRISLEVIDNGQGFSIDVQQGFNGHSLGLMNMNERVKALHGVFTVDSVIGKGTTVKAEFPVA